MSDRELAATLQALGMAAGLDAMGFAGAAPFDAARTVIERRRRAGLHAGMQFTYRNPRRSTTPAQALPGARSLVVGARRYLREQPPPAGAAGPPARIARYSWVDHYAPLRDALEAVADGLRGAGWRAVVLVDDNALVDRAAAHRAGLGWYGRNTMLLMPGAGSWYVLGSVVTDAALPAAAAPVPDGCGSCRRCVVACPTGALGPAEQPIAPGPTGPPEAPSGPGAAGALDARRCLAWLLQAPGVFPVEHRVALGDRLYGCDDCQEVCPVNRLGARRRPPGPAEAGATATVDALAILAAPDRELLAEWGRWYIPRRDPAYLRRNALLVLANTADPASPGVRRAVAGALRHPSPVVRAHAVWAARRLGHDDAVALVAGDADPQVRAELDPGRRVPVRRGTLASR